VGEWLEEKKMSHFNVSFNAEALMLTFSHENELVQEPDEGRLPSVGVQLGEIVDGQNLNKKKY
jgi:hypothetical protein